MRRRAAIGATFLGVIAALATPPSASAASAGRVTGQVSVDGKPVTEASVTLAPTKKRQAKKSTETDSKGRYSFAHVTPGRYDLRAVFRVLPGSATNVKCKYGAYGGLGITATLSGGTRIIVMQLTSKNPFEVEGGQEVQRDVEVDCSPNVRLDTARVE